MSESGHQGQPKDVFYIQKDGVTLRQYVVKKDDSFGPALSNFGTWYRLEPKNNDILLFFRYKYHILSSSVTPRMLNIQDLDMGLNTIEALGIDFERQTVYVLRDIDNHKPRMFLRAADTENIDARSLEYMYYLVHGCQIQVISDSIEKTREDWNLYSIDVMILGEKLDSKLLENATLKEIEYLGDAMDSQQDLGKSGIQRKNPELVRTHANISQPRPKATRQRQHFNKEYPGPELPAQQTDILKIYSLDPQDDYTQSRNPIIRPSQPSVTPTTEDKSIQKGCEIIVLDSDSEDERYTASRNRTF